jgi:hypothetical protein
MQSFSLLFSGKMDYKNMSTGMAKGRGSKREGVTRGYFCQEQLSLHISFLFEYIHEIGKRASQDPAILIFSAIPVQLVTIGFV